MAFSSFIFLFFFLPLALAAYLLTPSRYRNFSLLLIGLVLYEWSEGKYVTIVVLCAAVNYSLGLCLERFNRRRTTAQGTSLLLLILLISVNLSALVYFKYSGFLVSNLSEITELARRSPIAPYVPIGLSFLTFRVLSYIFDVYRGNVKAEKSIIRFSTYVALFPLMLAGPIVRYRDVAEQFASREVSVKEFTRGVRRFIIGLGKKVLVASTVAKVADQIFVSPSSELSVCVAWLGLISYTLQIYFDFSGYSDMAIGIGLMLGFEFPENFDYPYISRSVREFWRRWHITLSTWFRDYLYIPLGGNKVSEFKTYLNLLIVFVLCGLWHGANWTFIIWGLWHGIFLIAERTRFGKFLESIGRPVTQTYALLVVMIGWVFFRSENISQAFGYLEAMLGFAPLGTSGVMEYLNVKVVVIMIAGIIGSTPVAQTMSKIQSRYRSNLSRVSDTARGLIMTMDVAYLFIIMGLSIVSLAGDTYNPFIYANF
jgi:alginate O-acetyltransferase complex protein AlgI